MRGAEALARFGEVTNISKLRRDLLQLLTSVSGSAP
jgi:hypothetical protein